MRSALAFLLLALVAGPARGQQFAPPPTPDPGEEFDVALRGRLRFVLPGRGGAHQVILPDPFGRRFAPDFRRRRVVLRIVVDFDGRQYLVSEEITPTPFPRYAGSPYVEEGIPFLTADQGGAGLNGYAGPSLAPYGYAGGAAGIGLGTGYAGSYGIPGAFAGQGLAGAGLAGAGLLGAGQCPPGR